MINLRILSETRRRRFWSWFGEGGKGRKVVIKKSSYTTISSFWPQIVFEPCPCPSHTTSIRAEFLGFKRVGNTSRNIDWELCHINMITLNPEEPLQCASATHAIEKQVHLTEYCWN
jgi:hypothetical protein